MTRRLLFKGLGFFQAPYIPVAPPFREVAENPKINTLINAVTSEKTYSLQTQYPPQQLLRVHRNGLTLSEHIDYTAANNADSTRTVTFLQPIAPDDVILVEYITSS